MRLGPPDWHSGADEPANAAREQIMDPCGVDVAMGAMLGPCDRSWTQHRTERKEREMSLTIKARCFTCGDVYLTGPDVTVNVALDEDESTYSFTCPECACLIVQPATSAVRELLARVTGLRINRPPLELSERHPSGPPLTYDDLLDFVTALTAAEDSEIMARAVL